MPYTVGWLNSAEDELARIWMAAGDRDAVRRAADRMDHLLRNSSMARGNDRRGIYQMTILPLSIVYAVAPDDCKVTVLQVVYLP